MARRGTGVFVVRAGILLACIAGSAGSLLAQGTVLNHEGLSFLEEPLAVEAGDVSLVLKGSVEGAYAYRSQEGGGTDAGANGGFRAGARTQLPNRWRVDLGYSGRYATDPRDNPDSGFASRADDRYDDGVDLSVGGGWGTAVGGNVPETVRDFTRRAPGAGAAALPFDDVLGSLGEWAAGYRVRLGPWVLGAVADTDGDFDVGAAHQRPHGDKDYRLSVRYTEGAFTSAGGAARFDSRALSGTGEVIYGSVLFDAGAGFETLSSPGLGLERWYVSSGVRVKTGVVSLSLEGHYGRVEGEEEASAALGVRYDLARGLSANFGLNHEDARVNVDGVNLIDSKGTRAVVSLRFTF